MNKYQEAFDKSLTALRKQGTRCYDDKNCLYRHEDKKCAVGHLIPEENFEKMDHEYNLSTLLRRNILPGFDRNDFSFLTDLRIAHDNSVCWELDFEKNMEAFAKKWNLKYE